MHATSGETLRKMGRVNSSRPDAARDAIDLMTAWLDSADDDPEPLIACMRSKLGKRPPRDRGAGAVELIMGLTYLSGSLLELLEQATDVPARQIVQTLVLEYAHD